MRVAGVDIIGLRGRALRQYRARVGMIYQQFNLVRRLTVMDNVLIGRLPHTSGAWRWAALVRRFARPDREESLLSMRERVPEAFAQGGATASPGRSTSRAGGASGACVWRCRRSVATFGSTATSASRTRHLARALDFVARHRDAVPLAELVSRRVALDHVDDALAQAAAHRGVRMAIAP